jgi:hypothetical protein
MSPLRTQVCERIDADHPKWWVKLAKSKDMWKGARGTIDGVRKFEEAIIRRCGRALGWQWWGEEMHLQLAIGHDTKINITPMKQK